MLLIVFFLDDRKGNDKEARGLLQAVKSVPKSRRQNVRDMCIFMNRRCNGVRLTGQLSVG